MNSRLTTTLAIFRIEQDNFAQSTGTPIPGSNGETAYKAVDGTVSKGVEFELNGAITDNWQLTFGATRYIAERITKETPLILICHAPRLKCSPAIGCLSCQS